ncbi:MULTISPECIES: tetratricopeptide repeat protein [Streptomyces]|uniref:tetratricopeptide repeat protein n=1 Tax=Streptomyces TaxID=1883 RepID=UPI0004C958F3|nr:MULTISPECIES: tetratricopeptide repeat protein [Streptomyces]WSQ92531.1 tetratricopeptide repeat protein [Streptomyces globisporus]WSV90506.1 tetratricopeptide repeat protein [Streptomyces globisporus]
MSNQSVAAGVGLAGVMAHCGGNPVGAVELLVGAIASAPTAPEPYAALAELWQGRRSDGLKESLEEEGSLSAVLAQAYFLFLDGDMDDAVMALGSVTGVRPDVAWGAAPWFGDARFLGAVSAAALAEACLRTLDYGHDLDTDAMRERFAPWFHALDVVSERDPVPESLAAMARLPRACGRHELSFALCDRADAVDRVMWTALARAATWRVMGDLDQAAAAFEGALLLEPANWSLYLDLADVRAEQGDFAAAASLVRQGLDHEPHEVTLRSASAAYRTRLSGSADDLKDLITLAPELADTAYRNLLIDYACAGSQLPPGLVAEAHRIRRS